MSPGRVSMTLKQRVARYERIMAMRAQNPPMTYEEIGSALTPMLGRERVRQIAEGNLRDKAGPPGRVGRPAGPPRRDRLRSRLRYWERVRQSRVDQGLDTKDAERRIAALSDDLATIEVTDDTEGGTGAQ